MWLVVVGVALAIEAGPPPELAFDEAERAALAAGQTVYRYEHADGLDHGMAARLVDATPEAVWRHVLDYDAYVTYLPYVTASSTDRVEAGRTFCTMELTTKGIVTRYEVENRLRLDEGYVGLEMVATEGPIVKAASGWWQVTPWEDGRVLLAYRIAFDTAWWVPWFTKRYAARQGLPRVAHLVGERAEADPVGQASR